MKYDVFISYRREGGYDTAKHLNDLLVRDGYKVSFDIDTLRNGDFDTQLLERIEQCKDFILIVDKHAFDRTLDPAFPKQKDWLRCELAHALKHKKNIIPVFLSGVSGFPEGLPEDVIGVIKKNGPEFNKYYFDDFYKKLKSRFLNSISRKRLVIFIITFLILIALTLFYAYSKNDEITYKAYQNPSLPQTTSKELFDEYVSNMLDSCFAESSKDYNELLDSLKVFADHGDAVTQYKVGLLYYAKNGPKDIECAIDYFKLSAEQNYPQSLYSLAVCYDNAIYLEQDLEMATDLFYKAAKQGYAPAQNDYPISYSNTSKTPMAPSKVFEWFEKSANQGYAPAQYHLAYCYANNVGTTMDIDSYLYWMEKSADQNYKIAYYNLAGFYLSAPDEYKNIDLGFEMLDNLVKDEYPYAYYNLAQCYANGIAVDRDTEIAYKLIKDGAKKNDPVCIYALGINYFNPVPGTVSQNYKKGLELLLQAAEYGYPLAQYYIGVVYQQGLGVNADAKVAQKWFDLAAMQNATHQTVQSMNQ